MSPRRPARAPVTGPPTPRRPGSPALALVVGLLVTALGVAFAQPAPGAGDQAELAVAAWCWGVPHPTGYPLWTALAHGWVRLWGATDPAQALAWLSAVFAGCAAALTVAVGATLGSPWAGAGAALLFWTSPVAWQQATQVEVYPLLFVFFAAELALLVRATGAARPMRGLTAAAVVGGLGVTHHAMLGLLAPSALLVVGARRRDLPGGALAVLGLALAAVLPLPLYGLLLWRASTSPAIDWGHLHDLSGLWAHATAQEYAGFARGAPSFESLATTSGGVAPLLGLGGLAIAGLVGLGGDAAGPATTGAATAGSGTAGSATGTRPWVLWWVLGGALAATATFGAAWHVVDQEVFFLPFWWLVTLLAALGVARLAARWPVTWTVLVGLPLVNLTNVARLAPAWASHDAARALLEAAPADSVVYVEGPSGFTLLYPSLALGQRPDVSLVDPGLEVQPRYPAAVEALRHQPHPPGLGNAAWVLRTLVSGDRPVLVHPDDVAPDAAVLAEAGVVRLRAGVYDRLVAAGPPGARAPAESCGDVRFGDVRFGEALVLGRPCGDVDVAALGVVSAPLTWTVVSPSQAPSPSEVPAPSTVPPRADLVLVDAAEGEALDPARTRTVYAGPLGMGRPAADLPAANLPGAHAWTDPWTFAVPRDTPSGPRAVWLAVRVDGAWLPVEGDAPRQGPFVQLLTYRVTPGAASSGSP